MKKLSKYLILFFTLSLLIIITIPCYSIIYADTATPGTSLNLYQGAGVASNSYVKFGKYGGNDIIWRVLRTEDSSHGVFLISDGVFPSIYFDDTSGHTNVWRNSTIRTYLNGTFYDGLGTDKNYIVPTAIPNGDIDLTNTVDKIFLPSYNDMLSSPFNNNNSADPKRIGLSISTSTATYYWTRTGHTGTDIWVIMNNSGFMGAIGSMEKSGSIGFRPVLYLQKDLLFSGTGSISDPYIIITPTAAAAAAPYVAPVWIRPGPMVCHEVWVNQKGNFQFVFWYPYVDNNWVKIYDMSGKEVFSIDMPLDNPQFEVSLPDGMYTVKTFTVGSTKPIQTFIIGKNASTPRQDLGELSQ